MIYISDYLEKHVYFIIMFLAYIILNFLILNQILKNVVGLGRNWKPACGFRHVF
jgi:hypothetical protein